MPRYRIELAKTGRSSCRECGSLIDQGTPRFGTDDNPPGARWFHLACAPAGAPRAFKPFEKQAAIFARKHSKPAPVPSTGVKQPAIKRNPALEAAISRAPRDVTCRQVYADWLQEQGDPWGELIAFALAEDETAERRVFKTHVSMLTEGLSPKFFVWRQGFIFDATLEAKNAAKMATLYERLTTLRTAQHLERLALPCLPDRALMELVTRTAPPTLREFFTWVGPGLEALALPQLNDLTLALTRDFEASSLLSFLRVDPLKGLQTLSVYSASGLAKLPAEVLRGLLDAPALRRLDSLALIQNALDAAGVEFILANASSLKHLRRIDLGSDLPPGQEARVKKAFGKRLGRFLEWDEE